jgi:hypothetical protein
MLSFANWWQRCQAPRPAMRRLTIGRSTGLNGRAINFLIESSLAKIFWPREPDRMTLSAISQFFCVGLVQLFSPNANFLTAGYAIKK